MKSRTETEGKEAGERKRIRSCVCVNGSTVYTGQLSVSSKVSNYRIDQVSAT